MDSEIKTPSVMVPATIDTPERKINPDQLRKLGGELKEQFDQYAKDRREIEQRWVRNLRQYLGVYDPEIERQIGANRSKAYPRVTRVKCISVLSRIMNLMFPGNERNWTLKASPSADMHPDDVREAVEKEMAKREKDGLEPQMTEETIRSAVQQLANERAKELSETIDDQLSEIGGEQTLDYVLLNRKVAQSGIMYGMGCLHGPFVREQKHTRWLMSGGTFGPVEQIAYKPMFEFIPCWDVYPDMSAKDIASGDGYFLRRIMSKPQLRELATRRDFFGKAVKEAIKRNPTGNYKPATYENDVRNIGTARQEVEINSKYSKKYEVIVWHGPVDATTLKEIGIAIPEDQMADDVEAEVWMVDGTVIKADMNPWRMMGADVKTLHVFMFDEDDTSPIGNGLPNVVRDSQMSIAAAVRMMLDNASIVCGPQLELNTDLLRNDQDLHSVQAYKMWYRTGDGPEANMPAVRNIQMDSHIDELQKMVDFFMQMADAESFVGPATGGDMERGFSEPMRTAAGASMLRGDAALPFKDIVRNFDAFTQSVITSIVMFNRKFNPNRVKAGDFNVIPRGATSLIAKEVRGMQIDQMAANMTNEERRHVDERKMVEARFRVRDMEDMLLPEVDVERAKESEAQRVQQAEEDQRKMMQAEIRKTLSDAFKNITQGQKNTANADAAAVKSALELLETGIEDDVLEDTQSQGPQSAGRPLDQRPPATVGYSGR